jgi:hypothetical protein
MKNQKYWMGLLFIAHQKLCLKTACYCPSQLINKTISNRIILKIRVTDLCFIGLPNKY